MKSQYTYTTVAILGLLIAGWIILKPNTPASALPMPIIEKSDTASLTTRVFPKTPEKLVVEKSPKVSKTHPKIGKKVQYNPPPLPDLGALKLKQTETGGYMLFPVDSGESQGHMEIQDDLRDPLTAVGACTRWVVGCVDPGNRSLDDCARSVPQCATDKPWEEETHCCPTSCFDNYATLREAGAEPIDAFDTVYFTDGSCFPGLEELLSGATPAPAAIF